MFPAVIQQVRNFPGLCVAVWRQTGRLVAVSVAILGMVSCAVSPNGDDRSAKTGPEGRQAQVASRVKARWDALIKGDVDASYAFLSPTARETVTLEQYRRNTRKEGFRAAKIDAIECNADACTVKLWVTYDHPAMKGVETPLVETWVFDKGQAWYVYRG